MHRAAAIASHMAANEEGGDRSQIFSGHVDGIKFAGDALLKRFQDSGRGAREARIIETLSGNPNWSRFVPRFDGIVVDEEGASWMKMQNVTAGMKQPVVFDMKMGTRHYSPGEKEAKVAKELKKAATTTIGTLGLRIVGCKIPSDDYQSSESWGYKGEREANDQETGECLQRFLRTAPRLNTARAFISDLREHFGTQREYVFFGSSLLFAYDAALGDAAPLYIKMIDFGHVHSMEEMHQEAKDQNRASEFEPIDKGYVVALESMSNILGI